MKKVYRHYKFKTLRTIAALNLSFPLRYSIWNNAGILLIVFFVINFVSEEPFIDKDLSLSLVVAGFMMGGRMIADILQNHTIKD